VATQCPKCNTDNPDTSSYCADCGTQLGPPKDIGVTKTLETPVEEYPRGSTFADRYKIIEKLGTGGMGAVYRVEDTNIGQDIALKLIKPDIASDKKTIERFRNELKTTRMISHRNVCRMFDLAEIEGTYYITMEHVPGEDLKSLIRRVKRLDSATAIAIAKQVCEGLAEAHRLGVIHRDLKSNNIMIDKEGNARIMDFGIARSQVAKGITGEGIIIGTPEYMSPEQAEAKEVDHRSDIYSIGVILYEMVTGELPFEGDTPLSIAMKHKGETPKDPIELNPQIGEDLNRIILRCLEKVKEKRYQSPEELRSELENIEQGLPTSERAASKKTSVTSREITVSLNIRKAFIPAILISAALLVAVLIWQPWAKKIAAPSLSDKPFLAIMYFKNNTGDESLNHWRTALSDSIITDLSQSRYFEVLSSDQLFSILRKLNLLDAANYATEDLRQVAADGGVNYVLLGSLFQSGDSFRIDYRIQEIATGKNKGTSRVEVQGKENILSMVDEVTKKIKQEFNISQEKIAGDIDRDIGAITTRSDEALKYYSQGRQAHNAGEYRRSIALMQRAVAADPEFAMAYRSMAIASSSLRFEADSNEYMTKAYELSNRLPDRERYLIKGDFYRRSSSTYDKALENYNKLLEIYPEDQIANMNSAIIYRLIEQYDKAIERYEIACRSKSMQS
jgi:serine/threonine protein kinase